MTASLVQAEPRRPGQWMGLFLWIVLTIAIVLAARNLPWALALERIREARMRWLLAAAAANFAILPLWAAEWRILAPGALRVAYARMMEVVSVTAAVLNTVPFLAGEASAVALLIGQAGLSRGAALSVLALDQLLVAFAKIAVIAAAAIHAPLPTWLRAGVLSLVLAFVLLLGVLFTLAHAWTGLRDRLIARPTRLRVLSARLAAWGVHFDALRDAGRAWRVALLALGKKTLELGGILAVQMAFGLEPSVAAGLLVLAALAITTLLPIAPANLGVYEATVFAAYRYLGIAPETAVGLAIVQHVCFLLPPIVTGYAIVTMRHLWPRRMTAS